MNKDQKVNFIKLWLQKFGNRDNETFNIEVQIDGVIWEISMQFNFDEDGEEMYSYDLCRNKFKHLTDNKISDRSEEDLDKIIKELKSIKFIW